MLSCWLVVGGVGVFVSSGVASVVVMFFMLLVLFLHWVVFCVVVGRDSVGFVVVLDGLVTHWLY